MSTLDKFFALSTCVHCRRTREFFETNQVPCSPIYVDKLTGEEQQKAMDDLHHYNPAESFPTLVFSSGTTIVGFQQDKIRQELGL